MRKSALICLIAFGGFQHGLTVRAEHTGPVVGVVALEDSIYSVSQAGIFVLEGNSSQLVCHPPFRVFGMAGFARGESRRRFLVIGGGRPGESGEIGVLDLETKDFSTRRIADDLVYAVAVHPNGREAAIACADQRALTIDVPSLDESSIQVRHKHTSAARTVAYSPDGLHLASGGLDGVLLLSANEPGDPPLILQEHTAGIECVQFSPDSRYLASGARDARVRLHSADGRFLRTYSGIGMELMETGLGKRPYIWALAWSRDSSMLIAGTSRGMLYRLSLSDDTWKEIGRQESGPIYSLAFDNENRLFVGSEKVRSILPR